MMIRDPFLSVPTFKRIYIQTLSSYVVADTGGGVDANPVLLHSTDNGLTVRAHSV